MTDRQTVAGAYQKIEGHEELCAERYKNIGERLDEMKGGAKTQSRLLMGVLLSLLGWMAVQLVTPVLHPQQTQTVNVRPAA